jgi:hypothetical protein
LLVRTCFTRYDDAPNTFLMIKGKVRSCPAVTGFSRVALSNTCRSFRREASARIGPLGKISGGFEAPFQVRQLSLDASRVGRQEGRDAVPGPVRHLGGRDPVVEPLGHARVPVVVDPPSRGRVEDVRGRDGLARTVPRPADDRTRGEAAWALATHVMDF